MTPHKITDEHNYEIAMQRIEELETMVKEDTAKDNPLYIELDNLIEAVDRYEEEAYPIAKPSLVEVIKLRMYELGINKKQLSDMLGISASSVSKYLCGVREPSLSTARKISKGLNISSDIVLGV